MADRGWRVGLWWGSMLAAALVMGGCGGGGRVVPDAEIAVMAERPAWLVRHRLARPVVMPSADPAAIDALAVECPKVYRHDGRWWMFHTVIREDDGVQLKRIGLAVSDDLLRWEKRGLVVDAGAPGSWNAGGVSAPCLVHDGAQWWLFHDGFPEPGYEQGRSGIGAVTSTDFVTWHPHPANPLMRPNDDPDSWNAQNLYQCFILPRDDQWWMYYNARNNGGLEQMGLATSGDLVSWTDHPANPILTNGPWGASLDFVIIGDPWVIRRDGLWWMFYFGYDGTHARELLATSADGIAWDRWPGNPVIDVGAPGTYDSGHAHKPCVIEHEGVWYHFYVAEGEVDGRVVRTIALATSKRLEGIDYRED